MNLSEEEQIVVAASVLLGIVERFVANGARPAEALRFASVALVEEVFGRKKLADLGVPERTRKRWHAEVVRSMKGLVTPDEPPSRVLDSAAEALDARRVK